MRLRLLAPLLLLGGAAQVRATVSPRTRLVVEYTTKEFGPRWWHGKDRFHREDYVRTSGEEMPSFFLSPDICQTSDSSACVSVANRWFLKIAKIMNGWRTKAVHCIVKTLSEDARSCYEIMAGGFRRDWSSISPTLTPAKSTAKRFVCLSVASAFESRLSDLMVVPRGAPRDHPQRDLRHSGLHARIGEFVGVIGHLSQYVTEVERPSKEKELLMKLEEIVEAVSNAVTHSARHRVTDNPVIDYTLNRIKNILKVFYHTTDVLIPYLRARKKTATEKHCGR